jgi:acetyl esterase/lipase
MSTLRSQKFVAVAVLALLALAAAPVAYAQEEAAPQARGKGESPREAPRRVQDERPARPADEVLKWTENIEIVGDVVYATITNEQGEQRELQLDAAFPKQSGDGGLPAVVYIHGGGWSGGSREAGLPFTVAFANGGYFAVTISYRLSGEATYPAAVHDCKAAVRFLRANAEELGIDPDRIGVWGHSAGGHLSAMLGLTGDDAALEGNVGATGVSSNVACFVSVCGPSQLTGLTINGMVADFLGGNEQQRAERAVEASPVTHIDANDPPALLVHGTDDELVNIRQAHLLNDKMKEASAACELYIVEGAGHAIRDKTAYEKVAAFFDSHLGGSAAKVFAEVDMQRLNQLQPVDRQPPPGPRQPRANAPQPKEPSESAGPRRPGNQPE